MIVTNFPSKIAALQFEWAWQHPYRTRHIDEQARGEKSSDKKLQCRSARQCIPFLHMLLRSKSFSRWPLHVRFFAEDVQKEWQRYVASCPVSIPSWMSVRQLSDDACKVPKPRKSSKASVAPAEPEEEVPQDEPQQSIDDLDVTYLPVKSHVGRSAEQIAAGNMLCSICSSALRSDWDRILFCSHDGCDMSSHLQCLATKFLRAEDRLETVVPTRSNCPKCCGMLIWSDLVKELSLRMRGEAQVKKLFRKPRTKKDSAPAQSDEDTTSDDSNDLGPLDSKSVMNIDDLDSEPEETRQGQLPRKDAERSHCAALRAKSTKLGKSKAPPLPAIANSDPDDIEAMSE